MVPLIENNPFRIVGVYSDASLAEVIANANKLKAFAKIGKSLSMPIDAELEFKGCPQRCEESIDSAVASIQIEQKRIVCSLFWINQSGIDFGTQQLCVGDYKRAAAIFMKTLGVMPILKIQDVLGDRGHRLTSEDIIRLYVNTLQDEGVEEDIFSLCLSSTYIGEQLDFLQSIKEKTYLNIFRHFNSEVMSAKDLDSMQRLSFLDSTINKINKKLEIIVFKNNDEFQAIYDSICISVRSAVIEFANKTMENAALIGKDQYIMNLQKCRTTLAKVKLGPASKDVQHKFYQDSDDLIKIIQSAEETFLLIIADTKDVCWFCGGKATETIEKQYKKTDKDFMSKTESVHFYVCDKCKVFHDIETPCMIIGVVLMLIIEAIIIGLMDVRDFWKTFLAFNFFAGFSITFLGALGIAYALDTMIINKNRIRREIDHPLVKRLKHIGYK